jgi:hypothetical protein
MKNVKSARDIGGEINVAKYAIKSQILGGRTDKTTMEFASILVGKLRPVFSIHILSLANEYYNT